jgi:hypothetical protein
MVDRRTLLGGGLVTGLHGALAPEARAAAAGGVAADDDGTKQADAIDRLRRFVEGQADACELGPCAHVARIRQLQRQHLASAQRYPAFIEVGIDYWERIYDWHVKHQQRLDARRTADGRYAMTFMFTTLLLRADQPADYVGSPFDVEPRA